MPNFTNLPPADSSSPGFRLIRTPAGHPLHAYVLSENLIGCNTHFINNRTVPCDAPDCDPCQNGIGWRWHGYLLVLTANTQETVIFECTARASACFSEYRERYGTTRGAAFKAERLNNRPNGRVLIQAKPADLTKVNLPKAQPVTKLLCHIWNIPPNQVLEPDAMTRPPFKHVRVDRTRPETTVQPPEPDDDLLRFPPPAAQPSSKNGEKPK